MINGFPSQQVLGIGNEECCLDNDTHIKGIVYLFVYRYLHHEAV